MTEEFIYEREQELLDYFRNNFTDPSARSTEQTDTFTATSSQTEFELTVTDVKNVRETITVDSVTKYKGSDFTVAYGEGTEATTLILKTGATVDDEVVIVYDYGPSVLEREFSRTDTVLPRVIMMFLTGSEEFAGLGDTMEDGTGSYFNASYRFIIRDRYATRCRQLTSQLFNLARRHRHAHLYKVIISSASDLQNFDYDIEKECYIQQFTLNITWDSIFV